MPIKTGRHRKKPSSRRCIGCNIPRPIFFSFDWGGYKTGSIARRVDLPLASGKDVLSLVSV
jgi:hypothetical protein